MEDQLVIRWRISYIQWNLIVSWNAFWTISRIIMVSRIFTFSKKYLKSSSAAPLFVCLSQQPGKFPLTKKKKKKQKTCVGFHYSYYLLTKYEPSNSKKSFLVIYRQIQISIWKTFYSVSFLCSPWAKFMKKLLLAFESGELDLFNSTYCEESEDTTWTGPCTNSHPSNLSGTFLDSPGLI